MSNRGYTIKNQHAVHFITFAVVQWVDVFSRKEYADILVESLNQARKKKDLKYMPGVLWAIMYT